MSIVSKARDSDFDAETVKSVKAVDVAAPPGTVRTVDWGDSEHPRIIAFLLTVMASVSELCVCDPSPLSRVMRFTAAVSVDSFEDANACEMEAHARYPSPQSVSIDPPVITTETECVYVMVSDEREEQLHVLASEKRSARIVDVPPDVLLAYACIFVSLSSVRNGRKDPAERYDRSAYETKSVFPLSVELAELVVAPEVGKEASVKDRRAGLPVTER